MLTIEYCGPYNPVPLQHDRNSSHIHRVPKRSRNEVSKVADYKLSAVVFQEADRWVAQCLEYDIATQAKTLQDLYYELERTLVGQIVASVEVGIAPFEKIPPAPQRFWEMFGKASLRLKGDSLPFRMPSGVSVPTPELRLAA